MDNDDATLAGQLTPMTNQLVGEDLFDGCSNRELLAWRRVAQEEITTGVIQSSSAGDTTATRFGKMDARSRIRLINKTLWLRDPVHFPMNQPVKRTRPFYTYG
jgi:hypothetical protein